MLHITFGGNKLHHDDVGYNNANCHWNKKNFEGNKNAFERPYDKQNLTLVIISYGMFTRVRSSILFYCELFVDILYYDVINQVILYWPCYMSKASSIGLRSKAEGQYSQLLTCDWANMIPLIYGISIY